MFSTLKEQERRKNMYMGPKDTMAVPPSLPVVASNKIK
jgi:hypothetical protein